MNKKSTGRILVVDDDPDFLKLINSGLTFEGFICDQTSNLEEMNQKLVQYSYEAVLLDLYLGEESALTSIPAIIRQQPYVKIVVLTANASIKSAVQAMGSGATDFIEKSCPFDGIIERVKGLVAKPKSFKNDYVSLVQQTGIVGNSDVTREIIDRLIQLKDVNSTVLVLGESGVGKELVARALHKLSTRASGPFEAVNCGAVPETLLESELFGHKRGAFTDAKTDKEGLFELCQDGTLFLDEIGEMPHNLQVKLLRVIQEKEVRPLGSSKSFKVNTRIITATNRDLLVEMKEKRFREDLYYRLSVFVINIPPLRARVQDIQPLFANFFERFCSQYAKSIPFPGADVMTRVLAYSWPGNVRELRNSVERAVVLSPSEGLRISDLLLDGVSQDSGSNSVLYDEAKALFERTYLEKILSLADGNVSQAAKISGKFRSDIYRMMKRYQLYSDKPPSSS